MVAQTAKAIAPEPWPTKALSDCLNQVTTPRKIPRRQFLKNGPIPIISQEAEFINGYWDNWNDAFECDGPVVIFGDHTQVLKLVNFPFVVGADGVKILWPKKFLDASFLKYFLEANPISSKGYARHFRYIKNLAVPLPPLDEQERIVAVLDQAFAALDRAYAHTEANLANSQALYTGFLEEAFAKRGEWTRVSLGDHVRFLDYRGKTPPKSSSGIPLITAKNVRMGFVKTEPAEFVEDHAYYKWMTRGYPDKGDVLFTTEAPLANVAQLSLDGKVVIGQRLITMQTNHAEIDPSFLKWSLLSPQMQKDIHNQATGATVLGIKAKLLKKVPFYIPNSIEEQREIALTCEEAFKKRNELEQKYTRKRERLSALRQTLLNSAFVGELA